MCEWACKIECKLHLASYIYLYEYLQFQKLQISAFYKLQRFTILVVQNLFYWYKQIISYDGGKLKKLGRSIGIEGQRGQDSLGL